MREFVASLQSVVLLALMLLMAAAPQALTEPLSAPAASRATASTSSLLRPIHGFHCRPEPGWDARVGGYRRHRHDGICRDYQRCLAAQRRCIALLGRGFESWQYERWGSDNWRYTECMIGNGCY